MNSEKRWRAAFLDGRARFDSMLKSANLPFVYSPNVEKSTECIAIEFIGAGTKAAEIYANKGAFNCYHSLTYSLSEVLKDIESFNVLGRSHELINNPENFLEKNIIMQNNLSVHPKDAVKEFVHSPPTDIYIFAWHNRKALEEFLGMMKGDYKSSFFSKRIETIEKAIDGFKAVNLNAKTDYASCIVNMIKESAKIYCPNR